MSANLDVYDSRAMPNKGRWSLRFVNQWPPWLIVQRTGQRVTLATICDFAAFNLNGGSADAGFVRGFALGPAVQGTGLALDKTLVRNSVVATRIRGWGPQRSACDRHGVRHGSL